MTWMRTPTFTVFHDLSAVYTGAFKEIPSTRQALSPNTHALKVTQRVYSTGND